MKAAILLKLIIGGAFVVVAVAAFLPWSVMEPFSETGVEGNGVATLLLAAAGAASVVLGRRPRAVLIAAASALLCLLISLIDFLDVSAGPREVGSGLYLSLAGSVAASLATAALAFTILKRPDGEQAPSPPA